MDLLEREPYLIELRRLLTDAAGGSGRLLLLGGEAGVGKSALVHAFMQQALNDATVISSACDALSTPGPLSPVRAYTGALDVPFTPTQPEREQRDELFHSIIEAIARQDRPALMVLEDAHWSDEATLDLVRFIGRRIAGLPLLWVVTYRDDDLGLIPQIQRILGDLATAPGLRRMSLEPLSEASVGRLAYRSNLDPRTLFHRTGGNPFYVTEVLATGDGAIPVSVSDAVLARAARLSPPARYVLNVASVLGARAETELLLGVAGDVLDEIEECVERGLLTIDERQVMFRHQIARDTIYAAIIPPRRRLLHGRAVAVLREMPDRARQLAQLAHHAELAEDQEQMFEFAVAAARQAVELRAHREAAAQYARAIRSAGPMSHVEQASLFEQWAYECYLTSRFDDAIAGRQRALEIWSGIGDPLRTSENLRWLSRLYWFTGRNMEAEAAGMAALDALESLAPGPQLAWAYSNLAQLRMLDYDTEGAIRWGEQAIEVADAHGETEILAHSLNNVGTARLISSDERGRTELERSLAIARAAAPGTSMEEHAARAWTNLASISVWQFDLGAAERYLTEGLDYATRHDLDSWRFYMIAWRSLLHLHRGEWDAAERDCSIVLQHPGTAPITRIVALTTLGRLRTLRGDAGAMDQLDEALELAVPTKETQRLGPLYIARAEAAWHAGDFGRMASEAGAALRVADGKIKGWLNSEASYWLWRSGSRTVSSGDLKEPFALEISGDHAAASRAWHALGCPYYAARALLHSDQNELVREALAIFDQLGAGPSSEMALRRLREMGARSPRATTRAHPAGLTLREAEILKLIVAGSTNREIADRLYLSSKTVEHHVSAILGKLGVRTRKEAARFGGDHHIS